MNAKEIAQPEIILEQISSQPSGSSGHWIVTWRVVNVAAGPIGLLTVRLPHGQFKSEELKFEPAAELAPGEEREFAVLVRCDEAPGLVTENAFLIFYAVWLNQPWRIFVRIRVMVNSEREPEAAVELITTQQAGYSGVQS